MLMPSRLPVEDEGTLSDMGVLLRCDDRAVDQILGEDLLLRSSRRIGIHLIEITASTHTEGSYSRETAQEDFRLIVHNL